MQEKYWYKEEEMKNAMKLENVHKEIKITYSNLYTQAGLEE